jgi:hypothetical protein
MMQESVTQLSVRRPLTVDEIRYNQQALKVKAFYTSDAEFWGIGDEGAFWDVCGAEIAADGYIEMLCEICHASNVVATMVCDDGVVVPVAITEGAHVRKAELVMCPGCNTQSDEVAK